jgi:hypothetical protein
MEPKGFLIYPDRGILKIMLDISNTPPKAWTKIIQTMLYLKYPHEGIAFLLGFVKAMQYLSKSLDQNNSNHGVYRIPSRRYCVPFKFC